MKKWGKWKDIEIRTTFNGIHYLLQMRAREDGKKQFKNIPIDKGKGYTAFIGLQNIVNKIINQNEQP